MRLDRMKIMRRDRGLSQSELGARIGVLQPRVATIEGGASVTRETAEKIATALLCDVGDLVAPTETDHNATAVGDSAGATGVAQE
jgi:transcriptional regulator with XRE-family HTH domain